MLVQQDILFPRDIRSVTLDAKKSKRTKVSGKDDKVDGGGSCFFSVPKGVMACNLKSELLKISTLFFKYLFTWCNVIQSIESIVFVSYDVVLLCILI